MNRQDRQRLLELAIPEFLTENPQLQRAIRKLGGEIPSSVKSAGVAQPIARFDKEYRQLSKEFEKAEFDISNDPALNKKTQAFVKKYNKKAQWIDGDSTGVAVAFVGDVSPREAEKWAQDYLPEILKSLGAGDVTVTSAKAREDFAIADNPDSPLSQVDGPGTTGMVITVKYA